MIFDKKYEYLEDMSMEDLENYIKEKDKKLKVGEVCYILEIFKERK